MATVGTKATPKKIKGCNFPAVLSKLYLEQRPLPPTIPRTTVHRDNATTTMAPGAIQTETPAASNGTTLKPTARSFHPTGTPDPSKYHSSSTSEAISTEADFAAHNYHPLPIGVYQPVIYYSRANTCQSSRAQTVPASGIQKANITSTSSPHTLP